jgi:ABC-2 type transport system ATP-binding protein
MPDFFGVYDDMTVIGYLSRLLRGCVQDRARNFGRKRCNEMLDIVDLDFQRDAYANTLSRGQTQRLGLARTLLHDPAVLLLDEPLSGLNSSSYRNASLDATTRSEWESPFIVSSHIFAGTGRCLQ